MRGVWSQDGIKQATTIHECATASGGRGRRRDGGLRRRPEASDPAKLREPLVGCCEGCAEGSDGGGAKASGHGEEVGESRWSRPSGEAVHAVAGGPGSGARERAR